MLHITPELSKIYFLDSRFEMDHAVEWLSGDDNPDDAKISLDPQSEAETPKQDWFED